MRSKEIKDMAKRLEQESFYRLFETVVEASEILKSIATSKRKMWISHVIEDLYDQQQGKCAICGLDLDYGSHEVDHIIPHSFGGGNERANLQLACRNCNRSKRNTVDPNSLLEYLEGRAMNL